MSEQTKRSSQLERCHKISNIFEQSLGKPAGQEREAWLLAECGADDSLRAEVVALLDAAERAGGFLGDLDKAGDTSAALENPPSQIQGAIQPGCAIGPYTLQRRLGEGGFGEVFLADQNEPVRRQVALKIIKPGMDSREVMARFAAERQALAMMGHPNIATVLDAGATETGRPYFVMELVRGVEITKFCDHAGLDISARLTLFEKVCSAIQHAHQKGIIHRDIKPSNVLVTTYEGVPVPKVIDFGIAKAMQEKLTSKTHFTRIEQFIGTPAYMSPEQAEHSGIDLDSRADVYALGILLYELLVGRTPFDPAEWATAGFDEIRRRIREDIPRKPSTRLATLSNEDRIQVARSRGGDPDRLRRLIDGDLDCIVMKALEKDRCRRYESPSAFARDIARFRVHEPIEARPPSTGYFMMQFFRRHRLPCLAGLVSLVSLIAGLAVSLYGLSEANKGKSQAEINLAIAQENEAEAREQSLRADQEAAAVRRLLYPNILDAAMEALSNGKRSRAEELLATCPNAERGWEWRWTKSILIEPVQIYDSPGSRGMVRDLRLDLAGERMLAAFEDGSLQVWNRFTNRHLSSIEGLPAPALEADFNTEGNQIVSLRQDGSISLIDPLTGNSIDPITRELPVRTAVLSNQGKYMLAGETNGRITLWSGQSIAPQAVMEDRVFDLTCLAIDEENGLLAAGTRSGSALIWDASGIRLWEGNADSASVSALQFSPDGALLITGDEFGRIRIFSSEEGRPFGEWSGHRRGVSAVAFSKDGQTLASAGEEGGVSIRDISNGIELGFFVGDETGISSLVFSSDDSAVITGGKTGAVRAFNLDHIAAPCVYHGHEDLVFETALAPDGQTLISVSRDATLRFWDLTTGVELRRIRSNADAIHSVDVSADGKWIATRDSDSVLRLRRFDTGELVWEQPVDRRVRSLRFHPTAPRLAAGAQRNIGDPVREPIIAIWDIDQQIELLRLNGHRGEVQGMAFNPDATLLATTSTHSAESKDGRTMVWDLQTGKIKATLQPSPDAVSHSVTWSPSGRRIYTGHGDGRVGLWKATGENERIIFAHSEPIGALCLSPDGAALATGAWYSKEMKLWNATTGEFRDAADTYIPGLSDIHYDPSSDAWIVSGLDGGLVRLNATAPTEGVFNIQRKVAVKTRQAQLNEQILLAGGSGVDGFKSSVETLIRDYRLAWQLSNRQESFKHGPEELAATSLQSIAEAYLRSDLYEEAFIAMARSQELAPSEIRERQLRWIEEAQAFDDGIIEALSPEDLAGYIGSYQQQVMITSQNGKLIYLDQNLEEEWPLQRMQDDIFQLTGDATRRIRFLRPSPNAAAEALSLEFFQDRNFLQGRRNL